MAVDLENVKTFCMASLSQFTVKEDLLRYVQEAQERLIQLAEEVERLQGEARWVRAKLGLPEDTPACSGASPTLYGEMHVFEHKAKAYEQYIATGKCDDKSGEIARQSLTINRQREALEFYTRDGTYQNDQVEAAGASVNVPYTAPIFSDCGQIARAALNEEKP